MFTLNGVEYNYSVTIPSFTEPFFALSLLNIYFFPNLNSVYIVYPQSMNSKTVQPVSYDQGLITDLLIADQIP